jgi:hypothetical protein
LRNTGWLPAAGPGVFEPVRLSPLLPGGLTRFYGGIAHSHSWRRYRLSFDGDIIIRSRENFLQLSSVLIK